MPSDEGTLDLVRRPNEVGAQQRERSAFRAAYILTVMVDVARMAEPIWNQFLTERDKAVFAAAGYGARAGW